MGDGVDLATLALRVEANTRELEDYTRRLDDLEKKGAGAEKRALSLSSAMKGLAQSFAAGFVLREVIRNTTEAQHAQAQLEAGLRSTGGAAGKTATELSRVAAQMQQTTIYGDDVVKSAQAILLSFRSIKGDEFDRATKAAADLAARMGGDLKGSVLQVGKALEDPVAGLTALRRSGVSFTESQREMIQSLVESGAKLEAQRLILAEIETQFGGSAEAARNTFGEQWTLCGRPPVPRSKCSCPIFWARKEPSSG